MKQIVCEMCNGTEFSKQDGMFVCQSCGTKYSVEEAKKLMVELGSDVQRVSVDNSQELKNLFELARRARNDNNSENAQKYYEMILIKDPSSWEANFYATYYQSMNCKIANIESAAIRIINCEDTVLDLVKKNVTDPTERKRVIKEMAAKLESISVMLFNAAMNHYRDTPTDDYTRMNQYSQEMLNRCCKARDILYHFGDLLIQFFGNTYGDIAAHPCWDQGVKQHNILMKFLAQTQANRDIIMGYVAKIQKYDPSYQAPEIKTKTGGCYVATCVYGSYDCPPVWTLRRYRDYTLGQTWYGRAFIHTYYAISPTLVKWFGNTKWFKNLWKPKLDRMVKRLNEKGVEDTPYDDKIW